MTPGPDRWTVHMIERLIIAGYGGQGILTIGKLLGQCAIDNPLEVSYLPSYGSEVRGGTANCHLVISDAEIASPVIEHADSLIVMNSASFERFAGEVRPGGLVVLNSSLIDEAQSQALGDDVSVLSVDATNIAARLGNVVVANMIMTGAWLAARPVLPLEEFERVLERTLGARKADLLDLNRKAVHLGAAQAPPSNVRT